MSVDSYGYLQTYSLRNASKFQFISWCGALKTYIFCRVSEGTEI